MADISTQVPAPPPTWVEHLAKTGLVAKGVVYCLVGALAFMAAFELGSTSTQEAGKIGIFQFILEQPFGKWLLGLVALGLLCYTLWRFIQAFYDTKSKGSDTKGTAMRLRYIFSGLVYGALAYLAARLALGSGSQTGSGDSRETIARELLQQPFGQWLVGILGAGTILAGLYQIYYGYSDKYKKNVRGPGLKEDLEEKMIRAGKVGYMARGIVWLIIGYMFLQAALHANAQEAGGSSSAFSFLESAAYGSYLLGAVALGLICYGVFMFMRAKYKPLYT
ncbi:uncharacterized protein DUF1206 [Pontibacter ummariensis]|uniref:DUF1206 domain-containing protein n=1 Tax=Pontibacter ummariensis TaxID=1610492 RepID=A0A239FKF7_9BACT|nr:DUF1206 domain-containing protein [Pontibacter ummariensis]PRY12039.1 uncharacterized protein DUF1206 [Pontibacter ummariensis]SNS57251.1 protein of unknown function [Pontibacter ummariensis]